jgi:outer membrane lipoprotein-sorting protein
MSESEVKLADLELTALKEKEKEKIRLDVDDERQTLRKWKTTVAPSETGH